MFHVLLFWGVTGGRLGEHESTSKGRLYVLYGCTWRERGVPELCFKPLWFQLYSGCGWAVPCPLRDRLALPLVCGRLPDDLERRVWVCKVLLVQPDVDG